MQPDPVRLNKFQKLIFKIINFIINININRPPSTIVKSTSNYKKNLTKDKQ